MRNALLLATAVAGCLLACGCGRRQAEQGGRLKLTSSYTPTTGSAPLAIAAQEGYFAEQGLDVEFVEFQRPVEGLPVLAQGKLDVYVGPVNTGLLNAVARGADVRAVADKGHFPEAGPSFAAITIRQALVDEGVLADPSRLRGRPMIANKEDTGTLFVERALARVGLRPDDMLLREVPFASRPEAIASGAVDLADAPEPWLTRVLDTGKATIWVHDYEIMPGMQSGLLAYGPNLLRGNPDAGRRFMAAYLKAVRQYNEGKTDRNVEILARRTGLEPDLLRRAAWPPIRSDGRLNVEGMGEFQDWALGQGLLDRRVEPEEFWEPAFIEYVAQAQSQQGTQAQ